MNKIKTLLIAMAISALCGGVVIRSFFPKVEVEVREVKPTIHQLDSLATKIAEGRIDSLRKELDAKPKFIYLEKEVEGEPIIDSIKVYPQGFVDITNEENWKEEFKNKDRNNDLVEFTTIDSVRVTSYMDTLGTPYIGYKKFYSRVEKFRLTVSPEIREVEYINRFSLFINGGFIIDKKQVIENNVLTNKYDGGITIDLGIKLDEQWFIVPTFELVGDRTSYGLKFGTYLLRMGKCKRNLKK